MKNSQILINNIFSVFQLGAKYKILSTKKLSIY